ncbi:type I-E CRISPR-associated protein Cas5/CasD [[Collinsella] massiliensis]|uniref:Type I-E CRISPR-associated protein Cas5/CasD n=1 Tax=[Collinsella] massiliensis TaxID=1232426 RepID=A0A1Y3Y257_9ACTN|nr:type I-E CRISPR-associated protein Cas5/CasD [[Collinsella] massiliensis]OUN89449.1 type I-E CRISPR-associated protein Cas5/CasD [[Collinsella] massiliensis]
MSVLLLRLAGPMQSWGDSSRFARRTTRREPTKSGIVGLIASALGRTREDPVDDLAQLELAVRVEQPGQLMRDFQTERPLQGKPMPLSNRYYLADACFLAALGGSDELLRRIEAALRLPRRPLYLGRRSCPADMPLCLGIDSDADDVRAVLSVAPWAASEHYKARHSGVASLEVVADARDGELCESWADYPLTFSASGRRYACRPVVRLRVPNPDADASDAGEPIEDAPRSRGGVPVPEHDPLGWME